MNITIEDEGREIQDIQSEYIAGLKESLIKARVALRLTVPYLPEDAPFQNVLRINDGIKAVELALTGGKG